LTRCPASAPVQPECSQRDGQGVDLVNLAWLYSLLRAIGLFLAGWLVFVFPDGKFNPKWVRWSLIGLAIWAILYSIVLIFPAFLPKAWLDFGWIILIALDLLRRLSLPAFCLANGTPADSPDGAGAADSAGCIWRGLVAQYLPTVRRIQRSGWSGFTCWPNCWWMPFSSFSASA